MTTTRRTEANRRSLVVEAAGRVVNERGVEGVRIRQIAAQAGMSPAAVVYHFPDNSDLLLEVHQEAVRRYLEGRAAAQASATDPRDRLLATMRAGIPPWADAHVIRLLFEMHGLARRSAKHAVLMTELWRQERDLFATVIADGIEQSIFTITVAVRDAANALIAFEDGLALHLISNNSELTAELVVSMFASVAADLLHCPNLIQRSQP